MASASVPFVGPSYNLANRKADVQRTVNMYPQKVESGSGKAQFILRSVPGLTERSNSTTLTSVQGAIAYGDTKLYAVIGNRLIDITSGTIGASLGTLVSSGAGVVMAAGRLHVVMASGQFGYTFAPATSTFTQISDVDFPSLPNWVAYLAGRFVFGVRYEDSFYWSAIDDPLTYGALDFATAESSPDGLVRGIVYREELWLMGSKTIEVWRASSSADAAFERNTGVSISVGCAATHAVSLLDNSIFWVGRDENGNNVVYSASGYQPRRISNHAIEERLASTTNDFDIETATSYCWQWNGSAFYCLNVPTLDTTLCYCVNTDSWFEIAEFFNGNFKRGRVTHHVMSPLGTHYFLGALSTHPTLSNRAAIYTASDDVFTLAGDTLCRERTSPHYATPQLNRIFYPRFRLDCSVGTIVSGSRYVQLYYSNDGGYTWSASALQRSLGETGERRTMVQWNRLGSARDRVWKMRCTEDVLFDIVNVDVQAEVGTS